MHKIFALIMVFISFPAFSESAAPECNAQNIGMNHCFAQRLCECKLFPSSAMAGTPAATRWDCGLNRPPCIAPNNKVSTPAYDGPQAVGIDKSTTRIEQK